jgi:hypothetical protein
MWASARRSCCYMCAATLMADAADMAGVRFWSMHGLFTRAEIGADPKGSYRDRPGRYELLTRPRG